MRRQLLAISLAALPAMAGAQSFTAENRLVVVPLNGGQFEVIEARGEGPRGIWCAAADFARDRLGVPGTERVYISRGRGPSVSGARRKTVIFTSDPDVLSRPPFQSVSLSTDQIGMGLPVNHAHQFCKDYLLDFMENF